MNSFLQNVSKWYRTASYCMCRAEIYLNECNHSKK